MTTSAERKALNEGRFRDANERLEQRAVELVGVGEGRLVPFLCECPQMECTEVVLLTLEEYEQVRAGSRQGLAALGHEDPEVEEVVDRNDRFVTTEKFGRAGQLHAESDQREAVTEERIRRVAENEALYRQVNEQIREINEGFSTFTGEFSVHCECGTLDCTRQIRVPPEVYERTRSESDQFIVLPGHEIDGMEVVIDDHGAFCVITKTPPEAKRIAEELDPRA